MMVGESGCVEGFYEKRWKSPPRGGGKTEFLITIVGECTDERDWTEKVRTIGGEAKGARAKEWSYHRLKIPVSSFVKGAGNKEEVGKSGRLYGRLYGF